MTKLLFFWCVVIAPIVGAVVFWLARAPWFLTFLSAPFFALWQSHRLKNGKHGRQKPAAMPHTTDPVSATLFLFLLRGLVMVLFVMTASDILSFVQHNGMESLLFLPLERSYEPLAWLFVWPFFLAEVSAYVLGPPLLARIFEPLLVVWNRYAQAERAFFLRISPHKRRPA